MEGEYKNHKSEETQKVEIECGDEKGKENVTEEKSEVFKEISNGDGPILNTHVVGSEEKEEGNRGLNSILENAPSFESTKPVGLLSEALAQFEGNPNENLGDSGDTELESEFEKIMPLSDENCGISPVVTDLVERETEPSSSLIDSVSKGVEEEMLPASDENVRESSNGAADLISKGNVSSVLQAVATPSVEDGNAVENSYRAADLVSKENVSSMLQAVETPCVEDRNAVENSYGAGDLDSKGNVVPDVEAGDGGENGNISEVPESIENQPFVAVTPRTRTSWIGCCGLFDVLKQSNR
ncbi:hypothetical protein LguiA_022181 [Lonicera macranthoides]